MKDYIALASSLHLIFRVQEFWPCAYVQLIVLDGGG
jgi:hypothetical protein